MIKEELYFIIEEYLSKYLAKSARNDLNSDLDTFFKSNVCIPKGENPHPYSDVLHLMAEGVESEFSSDNGASWVSVSKDLYYCEAYRIKPSEPVYEYFVVDDKGITDWMTIQEFESDNDFKFIAEKTKRVRKW